MKDKTRNIIAGVVASISIAAGIYSSIPDGLEITSPDIFVQVRIKQPTPFGEFNDADYIPTTPEQREAILKILGKSEEDISEISRVRTEDFIQLREEQKNKPIKEPTDKELQEYKKSILEQKETLEKELLQVDIKLND